MNALICISIILFISIAVADLDKAISDSCNATKDCAIAYSICDKDSKKCACMKGFVGSNCQPPKLACPTWNGSPSNNTMQSCTWKMPEWQPDQEQKAIDTCKIGEFCFLHPKTFLPDGHFVHVGHCCPNVPENVAGLNVPCPLTISDPSRVCVDTSNLPVDVQLPEGVVGNCSFATQECVKIQNKFACCPQPCIGVSSHFNSDGKCYDTALMNETCTITAQCSGGFICQSNDIADRNDRNRTLSYCQCPNGKVNQSPTPHCEK